MEGRKTKRKKERKKVLILLYERPHGPLRHRKAECPAPFQHLKSSEEDWLSQALSMQRRRARKKKARGRSGMSELRSVPLCTIERRSGETRAAQAAPQHKGDDQITPGSRLLSRSELNKTTLSVVVLLLLFDIQEHLDRACVIRADIDVRKLSEITNTHPSACAITQCLFISWRRILPQKTFQCNDHET